MRRGMTFHALQCPVGYLHQHQDFVPKGKRAMAKGGIKGADVLRAAIPTQMRGGVQLQRILLGQDTHEAKGPCLVPCVIRATARTPR